MKFILDKDKKKKAAERPNYRFSAASVSPGNPAMKF